MAPFSPRPPSSLADSRMLAFYLFFIVNSSSSPWTSLNSPSLLLLFVCPLQQPLAQESPAWFSSRRLVFSSFAPLVFTPAEIWQPPFVWKRRLVHLDRDGGGALHQRCFTFTVAGARRSSLEMSWSLFRVAALEFHQTHNKGRVWEKVSLSASDPDLQPHLEPRGANWRQQPIRCSDGGHLTRSPLLSCSC